LTFSDAWTETVIVTGQRSPALRATLSQSATLRGRVLDNYERGIPGLPVEVLRPTINDQGRRAWSSATTLKTDAEGRFEHTMMGPGEYYIRTVIDGMGALPLMVFYPDSLDSNTAVPLMLTEGNEAYASIRVDLSSRPMYRISGTVVLPVGVTGTTYPALMLVARNTDSPLEPANSRPAAATVIADPATGRFELRDVRPGSYDLFASSIVEDETYYLQAEIEVRDRDIDDLRVALRKGHDISGRLVSESGPNDIAFTGMMSARDQNRSRAGDIQLTLRRQDGLPFYIPPRPQLGEDGRSFLFRDLPEGRYAISATIVGDGRVPAPDLYVSDIRAGGRSVFDDGFTVGVDAVGSINVVVAYGGGILEGAILGRNNLPAALILAPEYARRNNPALYRILYTPRNASFQMNGLVPGAYRIFAVPYVNQPIPYRNPEFLARHESLALPVIVRARTSVSGLQVPFIQNR
jgi:hypothetical protein